MGIVDKDDVGIYVLEHYIFSLQVALEKFNRRGKIVFIHLPFFQVYNAPDGSEIILTDWWETIVKHFNRDSRVAGFYIADEPEVWGSEWSSHKTGFPHSQAVSLYTSLKKHTEKDILAVFCDIDLYRKAYADKPPFFDIFGFDFYPFSTQSEISRRGLGFLAKSKKEGLWIEEVVKKWASLIFEYKFKRVYYVGQGCGERSINGDKNWTQRDMTLEDFGLLGGFLRKHLPVMLEGYILWSWDRADKVARHNGTVELQYQEKNPIVPKKTSWFIRLIRRLFR
jgi:hypothetical protein